MSAQETQGDIEKSDLEGNARAIQRLCQLGQVSTYSANNPAFNPATATQMPTDSNLQGAIAAAWHH
jgi:hypothetical protein